jgi:hypothetical protein
VSTTELPPGASSLPPPVADHELVPPAVRVASSSNVWPHHELVIALRGLAWLGLQRIEKLVGGNVARELAADPRLVELRDGIERDAPMSTLSGTVRISYGHRTDRTDIVRTSSEGLVSSEAASTASEVRQRVSDSAAREIESIGQMSRVGPRVGTRLGEPREASAAGEIGEIKTADEAYLAEVESIGEVFAEVERLIAAVERLESPVIRDLVREAAARGIERIGWMLIRVGELVGPVVAAQLAGEETIGMLHVLAGTHPEPAIVRARRALEGATVELASVNVRFAEIAGLESAGNPTGSRDAQLAEVDRLASAGETCVIARDVAQRGEKVDPGRVRGMIEMIVTASAPDLDELRVEIDGLVAAQPDFVPLARLRPSTAHERCTLCSAPIGAKHDHLDSPERREIACACDGCALIIPSSEYARYRRVPRGVQRVGVVDVAGWLDRLNVPVGIVAIVRDDRDGARLAYPGPAGLVEATVDPAVWSALCSDVPAVAGLVPETEALVWSALTQEVLRTGIDVVFRLVGELRTHWRGIHGGEGPAALARVLAELVEEAA